MRIRDKAREQAEKSLGAVREMFQKSLNRIMSKSWFKRNFGSSIYQPHSNDRERTRNLKNFPSLDLGRFKH